MISKRSQMWVTAPSLHTTSTTSTARSAYPRADDHCDRVDVLQGSHNVEKPLPSECAPAVGGDNGEKTLRNGLRMDGQWEYQPVHRGTQGCKSV